MSFSRADSSYAVKQTYAYESWLALFRLHWLGINNDVFLCPYVSLNYLRSILKSNKHISFKTAKKKRGYMSSFLELIILSNRNKHTHNKNKYVMQIQTIT